MTDDDVNHGDDTSSDGFVCVLHPTPARPPKAGSIALAKYVDWPRCASGELSLTVYELERQHEHKPQFAVNVALANKRELKDHHGNQGSAPTSNYPTGN